MRSFETFREISDYTIDNLTFENPSCFNGDVRVIKYKVTIEKIEESIEVIQKRIQKLWDECDNWHHREPLRRIGKKYGLNLQQGTPLDQQTRARL